MDTAARWEEIYHQVPLCEVPRHFAGLSQSPFLLQYLQTVHRLCPRGGRSCEIGIGSGYGAVWLSRRGIHAEGIDNAPGIVERAHQVNNLLQGQAAFREGDMFRLYADLHPNAHEGLHPDVQSVATTNRPYTKRPHYDVIHHQGVLEHLPVPWIRAALAQQVACADHVVFSVPSVHYPFDPEFGNERLLDLQEWQRILAPFDIEELRFYGDPQLGGREHILGVLRGQQVDDALLALMEVAPEPYPQGISAVVHTRNEARHIEACLQSLQGWTDEIIVCDMESTDDTVEIARRFTDQIIAHPRIANFDRARNASAMRAGYRWVFYLDADERVPPELGPLLRGLTQAQDEGSEAEGFEGLLLPFRHHFAGQWLRCLYPGYTAPRLFKNGRFHFNPRLHSGAEVEGRVTCFPADRPELALVHYSFDNLSHYLDKLNRYTDGEAQNLHRDGQEFHWQGAIAGWVRDFASYYDGARAGQDGVHGFLYAFLSGFYRFEQQAKLYERRYGQGQLQAHEQQVPQSVEQVLEYALSVLRHQPLPQATPIKVDASLSASVTTANDQQEPQTASDRLTEPELSEPELPDPETVAVGTGVPLSVPETGATQSDATFPLTAFPDGTTSTNGIRPQAEGTLEAETPASIVWSGPLTDPSGYGEESRQFVLGLDEVGVRLAIQALPWSQDEVDTTPVERERLDVMAQRVVRPGFVHVTQNFPPAFARHPHSAVSIGRTMFETDRLPDAWVRACNRMDWIWVPSEFNRQTFAAAGVAEDKLVVIPGCLDPAAYQSSPATSREATSFEEALLPPQIGRAKEQGRFVFLTVFDWTLHKGWDVLLRAFLEEFGDRDDITLVLKVWSTMGYSAEQLQQQAAQWARRELDYDLLNDTRIVWLTQRLTRPALTALFQACDAFVLPSRGEGWGRPYMEAMACGKPTIGTRWSGNTAFMNEENSYLIDCRVQAVPEVGWREIPTYRGHRWAEPDPQHLRQLMRTVFEDRSGAKQVAQLGQQQVLERFNRQAVGTLIRQELERVQAIAGRQTTAGTRALAVAPSKATTKNGGSETVATDEDEATDEAATADTINGHKADVATLLHPPSQTLSRPACVRWEGDFFRWHSLAHVNRELCLGLLEQGVELSLVPPTPPEFDPRQEPALAPLATLPFAPLSRPAEVHVRHSFPPRFTRPQTGHLVLMQPWEYGYLPQAWIEPIREQVDEVWCYSESVREVYRASGIADDKLHLVPLGVDTQVFHPQAPPYIFTLEPGAARLNQSYGTGSNGAPSNSAVANAATDLPLVSSAASTKEQGTPFVFLFVGGTLHRKGIDILLEAYLRAFSAYDDVALVIKDTGTQTVYRGQNERERIIALAGDDSRPPLVYLDHDLSPHALAGLYTSADCVVLPYRGEGFCLPALEAMACGRPVLVPAGGPTDDFVDETVGWRLPARRQPFAIQTNGLGQIGDWECVGPTWMWEVEVETLARQMRQVFSQREEVKKRGAAAAVRVQESWTWQRACQTVEERIEHLRRQPIREAKQPLSTPVPSTRVPNLEGEAPLADAGTQTSVTDEASGSGSEEQGSGEFGSGTISLCMIVRDEERVLGDCLQSVKAYVDEIIVVDTGSTDRTVEIAHEYGARVFHFPWCDDFSAARNESLRHALGEWIFWMDADDTIPAHCGEQLRDLSAYAEEETTGFLMQVQIPPAPGEHGFTVVDHVKLFRNRPELRFEGRIHEQILEPIYRSGGRVERTDLFVVHSGYDYSAAGQHKKRERDLSLLRQDLAERPDHPFVLFNIGMTAFHLKDFEQARPVLERCLQKCKPRESIVRKVYAMLAGCHLEQKRLEQAVEVLERGLGLFPHDPELLFRAGIIYREAGDLQRAEQSYQKLLTQRETGHIDSLDVTMTGFKAHHNLALIYQDMGRLEEAEREFRQAVELEGDFLPSRIGLAEILKQRSLVN